MDEGLTGLNGDLQLYNTRIGGRFWGNNHLYFTADLGISSFLNNAYPSFPSDFSSKVYDFSMSHGIGYLVKFWPNSGLDLGLRFDWNVKSENPIGQLRIGYRFGL